MEALLERKAMELRDDFQKKLRVSEEGPTAEIDELEKLLKNERECFSVNYRAMFMSAIEEMKNRNQQQFQGYCKEQTRATQDVLSRVKISPRSMEALLERKAMELRDDFQKKLRVSEEGPTAEIDELEKLLKNERECFSVNYRAMFMSAIEEMKNRTLQQFQGYCKEQMQSMESISGTITNTPISMRNLLENYSKQLMQNFRHSLGESEMEMENEISQLDMKIHAEVENCVRSFTTLFNSLIRKLKKKKRQEFETFCTEKERDTEGIFGCIKIHPGLMKRDVEKKTKELLADFGRRLDGDENEKVEQMLELERSIQSEVDSFCHAFGKRYRLEMVILVLIGAFAGAGIGYMCRTAIGAAIAALKSALTGAAGSALTGAAGSALTGAAGSALTGAAGSALTGAAGSALTGAAGSALTGAAGSALTEVAGSALTGVAGSALTEAAVPTLTGACLGAITAFGLLSLMQYIERGDDAEEENGLQKLIVWLQKQGKILQTLESFVESLKPIISMSAESA
ncbi:uncharacterized protein LOC144488300 isoform X2 [Mustelus asterias]